MGKKTGTLIRRRNGWAARFWLNGERVYIADLGTDVRTLAQAKLDRIIASGVLPKAAPAPETFEAAAERVHVQRAASGVRCAADEIARLRRFASPTIGAMSVTAVAFRHVNAVLDECKAAGKSRQTVAHLRQAIRVVFAALKREGVVTANPVDDAEMPRFPSTVRKERAVLRDDELLVYLAYQHPQPVWQYALRERQTMAVLARTWGGLRTGDAHALRWEAFDVPEFTQGWAPRRKTRRPQLLKLPEVLRPILRDWWERAGRPTTGFVFPAKRGDNVGGAKTDMSHADAFRRDLRRAFGIDVWNEDRRCFETVRELTARERELFTETEHTLPVDWHSWRRKFSQGLADANVTAQEASALAGHASLGAHALYLASAGRMRVIPEAALPRALPRVLGRPQIVAEGIDAAEVNHAETRAFSAADLPSTGGIPRHRERDGSSVFGSLRASLASKVAQTTPAWPQGVAADTELATLLRLRADGLASIYATTAQHTCNANATVLGWTSQ